MTNANGVVARTVRPLTLDCRSDSAGERWVTAFTNPAGTGPIVFMTLTLTAAMFATWRRRSIPLLMVIAAAGSLIFTSVGKTVVGRARPPLAVAVPPYEYAPAFPSGHALNSAR